MHDVYVLRVPSECICSTSGCGIRLAADSEEMATTMAEKLLELVATAAFTPMTFTLTQ